MLGLLLDRIQTQILPKADRGTSLHATLISKQWFRKGPAQHVTWLVFVGDEVEPRFVARQAVEPGANETLDREAQILKEVCSRIAAPLAPPVLDVTTINGLRVLISQYLPDSKSVVAELAQVPLIGGIGAVDTGRLFARHFEMALRALLHLRTITAESTLPAAGDSEAGQLLHEALSWFDSEHRNQIGLTRGALESIFATVADSALPAAGLVHFDFVPGNLLSAGENVILVDWEAARWSTFWWFDPLKFVYMYVTELNRFGITENGDDPVASFLRYLDGDLAEFHVQADRFLEQTGFPVGERDTMRAYWLAYALCEMKLFLSACPNPEVQLAPYGRLIGGILDLGDSPGGVQEQLERLQAAYRRVERDSASLQAEHAKLLEERDKLQEDKTKLQEDKTRLQAGLDQQSRESAHLAQSLKDERARIAGLQERLRLSEQELAQIQGSKLWKLGSAYWRILSWLGHSSKGNR